MNVVGTSLWFVFTPLRVYTLTGHFNRNTCASAHACTYPISQSCSSMAIHADTEHRLMFRNADGSDDHIISLLLITFKFFNRKAILAPQINSLCAVSVSVHSWNVLENLDCHNVVRYLYKSFPLINGVLQAFIWVMNTWPKSEFV